MIPPKLGLLMCELGSINSKDSLGYENKSLEKIDFNYF